MERSGQSQVKAPRAESIIGPALKVGALSGAAGFVTGGVAGVIRNTPPFLFATASSIQWFGLGTTFWFTRSFVFQAWDSGKGLTRSDKTSASAIAGGVAGGGIGLVTRGPRNVIPGTIMFSLFGFLGQTFANTFDKSAESISDEPQQNVFQRFASLKWSPVSVLSDADYENMLREKQLKLEAEIAIVDERIAELKRQHDKMIVSEKTAS